MMISRRQIQHVSALGLAMLALAAGCEKKRWSEEQGDVEKSWAPTPSAVRGVAHEALHTAIQARLAGARPQNVSAEQWKRVQQLYNAYNDVPLWLEPSGPTSRAKALISELAKAPTHALRLTDYPLSELRDVLRRVTGPDSANVEELVAADVLLSASYVTL